jgi:hypothetical protein
MSEFLPFFFFSLVVRFFCWIPLLHGGFGNRYVLTIIFRPLLAKEVAKSAVWMLQQPEKISIKALDVVPSAQRSLSVFDRQWNERRQGS